MSETGSCQHLSQLLSRVTLWNSAQIAQNGLYSQYSLGLFKQADVAGVECERLRSLILHHSVSMMVQFLKAALLKIKVTTRTLEGSSVCLKRRTLFGSW